MAIFSSRPPFEINDDPLPWLFRSEHYTARYMVPSPGHVYASQAVYRPRPEFDRPQNNPTNPILAAVRAGMDTDRESLEWLLARFPDETCEHAPRSEYDECTCHGAQAETEWGDARQDLGIPGWPSDAHIDHARRVLTRLANLSKGDA